MLTLRRFPLTEIYDTEQFRHHVATRIGARDIEFPGGHKNFCFKSNFVSIKRLGIYAYSANTEIASRTTGEDFYRYQISKAGHTDITAGMRATQMQPGDACLLNAGQERTIRYSSNSEQIVLRITADTLKSKLQALIGVKPNRDIEFDTTFSVAHTGASGLRSLVGHLVNELDTAVTAESIAAIELKNILIGTILLENRHNYSAALAAKPKSSAPFQVRLAEEYIEANWDRPITIEMLTEVTGVSSRSLFERFHSYRGVSPMTFLRQVRLERARTMLMSPKPGTTVTGVALACGFLNTGHFARHYREMFGELPSKILAASRSLATILIGLCIGATGHGWFKVKSHMIQGLVS